MIDFYYKGVKMHIIRAFIAEEKIIRKLAVNWLREPTILPQGFALLFLTEELFDDIEERKDIKNTLNNEFEFFTSAVSSVMEDHSSKGKLAYIETEYFGGVGGQGGVLYVDGKMKIAPTWENDIGGIINRVLSGLGVIKTNNNDEFDSIHLCNYRSMK